jgi:hypothetical protein
MVGDGLEIVLSLYQSHHMLEIIMETTCFSLLSHHFYVFAIELDYFQIVVTTVSFESSIGWLIMKTLRVDWLENVAWQ